MANGRLETLIWVLIYGGLLLLCLGVFVRRGDASLGAGVMIAGAALAALGAILIWVRSRRPR